MKIATLVLFASLCLGLACQRRDDLQPDALRKEPVSLQLKDVELTQSTLAVSYEKIFNVTRNGYQGIDKREALLGVSDIRQSVEAFIAAHPDDYALYFRVEFREFKPDVVLPNGSLKFRAGGTTEVSGSGAPPVAGTGVDVRQFPYAWESVSAEIQKNLRTVLAPRLINPGTFKLMLSVYDTRRFPKDATALSDFDGSVVKSYEEGGSRILYRGWNLEVK